MRPLLPDILGHADPVGAKTHTGLSIGTDNGDPE